MFEMKGPTGEPLFESMQISLVCAECLLTDHPEKCRHRQAEYAASQRAYLIGMELMVLLCFAQDASVAKFTKIRNDSSAHGRRPRDANVRIVFLYERSIVLYIFIVAQAGIVRNIDRNHYACVSGATH